MSRPSRRPQPLARAALAALVFCGPLACWEQWSNDWWPQMKYQKAVQAYAGGEFAPNGGAHGAEKRAVDMQKEVLDLCPTKCMAWDGKELKQTLAIDFFAEKLGAPHQMRFGAYALYGKQAPAIGQALPEAIEEQLAANR